MGQSYGRDGAHRLAASGSDAGTCINDAARGKHLIMTNQPNEPNRPRRNTERPERPARPNRPDRPNRPGRERPARELPGGGLPDIDLPDIELPEIRPLELFNLLNAEIPLLMLPVRLETRFYRDPNLLKIR